MAAGVPARANSRAEAWAVTSSFVRKEMMQETRTLYGLFSHWATIVTAGLFHDLYSSRRIFMTE